MDFPPGALLGVLHLKSEGGVLEHLMESGEKSVAWRQFETSGHLLCVAFELPQTNNDVQIRRLQTQFAVEPSGVFESEWRKRGNTDQTGLRIGDLRQHLRGRADRDAPSAS